MMRWFGFAAVAASLLIASCSGETSKTASAPEFSGERIKTDVAFLADDKLEGR